MEKTTEIQKRDKALKRFGIATATGATALIASQTHALDVAGATSGSTADSDIETGAVWVLGIAVTIFAARKVIGFFGR